MIVPSEPLLRLLAIMQTLRDPQRGCDWDRTQTFDSIASYTIEEAYEVGDAIGRCDMRELQEELGDLLLQVVFHSQIAAEAGAFTFADVAQGIADKMTARHPHIFGEDDAAMSSERWEELKALERNRKGSTSALDGVARALPALMRAEKLQKRAARDGFDWPDPSGPEAKLLEELVEFTGAEDAGDRLEEAGDLLFAAVNLLRKHDIDAEAALRQANEKFERRYRGMEKVAGGSFGSLSLDEQEKLWSAVKLQERRRPPQV